MTVTKIVKAKVGRKLRFNEKTELITFRVPASLSYSLREMVNNRLDEYERTVNNPKSKSKYSDY